MIINAHIAKLDNETDVLFAGLTSLILAEGSGFLLSHFNSAVEWGGAHWCTLPCINSGIEVLRVLQ